MENKLWAFWNEMTDINVHCLELEDDFEKNRWERRHQRLQRKTKKSKKEVGSKSILFDTQPFHKV